MVIAIDPGHGGREPGAVYNGRQEKDDVLKLALAVGNILERNGVDVYYTRESDIYETPFKKATDGNSVDADYFVSFHRNSSEYPNQYSGAEVLVYSDTGVRSQLANNILEGMEQAGYKNLGVDERKDLVVLRRTNMPAVLVEAGFINNDTDNKIFDENFDMLAQGIADGIFKTLGSDVSVNAETYSDDSDNGEYIYDDSQNGRMNDERYGSNPEYMNGNINAGMRSGMNTDMYNGMNNGMEIIDRQEIIGREYNKDGSNMSRCCSCPDILYRVQVGAYRNRDSADRLLNSLLIDEFPAFIVYDDGLYKVQVGAYRNLSNAIAMEYKLRQYRYNTYITTK